MQPPGPWSPPGTMHPPLGPCPPWYHAPNPPPRDHALPDPDQAEIPVMTNQWQIQDFSWEAPIPLEDARTQGRQAFNYVFTHVCRSFCSQHALQVVC